MKSLMFIIFFLINISAQAQTTANTQTVFDFLDAAGNFVKNPHARLNAIGVTASSATCTRGTTDKLKGVASWSVDASAQNGYCEFALRPIFDETKSANGNCEFKGQVKGDGSLYKAQILDGSSVLKAQTQVLENNADWRVFSVNSPCQSTPKIRITQTEAGTAPAISVGLYYGSATNIGKGTPPNTFTAEISTTGTVSNITPLGSAWINSVSPTDTSLYTNTFNGFTAKPNCTLTAAGAGDVGTANRVANIVNGNTNASQIQYRTTQAGTKTALDVFIRCTKTGADYVQNAVTANQTDFTEKTFVPTGSWTTNSTYTGMYSRDGNTAKIKVKVALSGAPNATTLSINLPPGLAIDTAKLVSTVNDGNYLKGTASILDNGSTIYAAVPIFQTSTSFLIRLLGQSNTYIDLQSLVTQATPMTFASGDSVDAEIEVPILGWTETHNAPQLLGSVTSNSSNALRIESALVSSSGTVSQETSDWINGNASVSIGTFTLTKNAGGGGLTNCWATIIGTPSASASSTSAGADSTTVSVTTYTNNAYAAQTFMVFCLGAR